MEIFARSFIKELDVMKNRQRGSLKVQDGIHTCWEVIKVVWGATLKNEMIHFVTLGTLLYCNFIPVAATPNSGFQEREISPRGLFWLLAKERMPQPLLPA
jgi:hypothetical protein